MSGPPAKNGPPPPDPDEERYAPPDGDGKAENGDLEQWREILVNSERGLRRFLAVRLPQAADVEDCFQAVSMAMLKNSTPIPAHARRAWLFQVAANEAALWWRKKSAVDRAIEQHAESVAYDQTPPSQWPPHSDIETNETIQKIHYAIARLPSEVRQIITMRLSDSMTFQQIAEQLEIPIGTVLTRMRRGMKRLRSELDEKPLDETS